MNNLNYKTLEKFTLLTVLISLVGFAIYYFIFKIDWAGLYIQNNSTQIVNYAVLNESCIKCHGDVVGFSEHHNPKKIGCSSCHGGNTKSSNRIEAHEGMIRIPGNNYDAVKSCGNSNCHPGIAERVANSPMSTMSGIISVDKYAFDEINEPTGLYHIDSLKKSAADVHLRNLCASCHLGNIKQEFGPITELSRGGGCNACHLNYTKEAKTDLEKYIKTKATFPDSALIKFHPTLSLKITNDHCFGCHSRSGRISTGYEGYHETSLTHEQVKESSKFRLLQDGRVFEYVKADVHSDAGLVCIDCHISYEVMGDGNLYEHKEQQIIVECIDCHSNEFQTINYEDMDVESKKIIDIRKYDRNNRFIKLNKKPFPLVNSYVNNQGKGFLVGKGNNKEYELSEVKFECVSSKVHESLTCNSCHTSWAPQCVGCHTQFEPGTEGFDLLANKEVDSTWVEYHGEFFAEYPTLGVRETNEKGKKIKRIETFIPGMIMTLDKSKFLNEDSEPIFKRLFAPVVAHTIQKESRSCESCHNSSLALGYGRGDLEYVVNNKIGKWVFSPEYSIIEYDGLPEDAWTGFLTNPKKSNGTRANIRPFNLEEQKSILKFGSCLTCHKDKDFKQRALRNYEILLNKITQECVIPTW